MAYICAKIYAYLIGNKSTLSGSAIIDTLRDDIPTSIYISQATFEARRCCGHCEHDRSQHSQLIIHISTFIDISGLKRNLLYNTGL